jgi:hypothetical protein
MPPTNTPNNLVPTPDQAPRDPLIAQAAEIAGASIVSSLIEAPLNGLKSTETTVAGDEFERRIDSIFAPGRNVVKDKHEIDDLLNRGQKVSDPDLEAELKADKAWARQAALPLGHPDKIRPQSARSLQKAIDGPPKPGSRSHHEVPAQPLKKRNNFEDRIPPKPTKGVRYVRNKLGIKVTNRPNNVIPIDVFKRTPQEVASRKRHPAARRMGKGRSA